MIELKVYAFKEEFCKELGIPKNQSERRLNELLEWLNNFFVYEFYKGRPNRIQVKEIIGEYQPLPRKLPKQDELTKEKKKDYEYFTQCSLGPDFKPNSKSRIARQAINNFGKRKYGHTNYKAVSERYIKEPFDKYGETNNKNVWVDFDSYLPLTEDELEKWKDILKEERIDEGQAAEAFYRQEQGQDVSKEKQYYKNALDRALEELGIIPVLVKSWRLKPIK